MSRVTEAMESAAFLVSKPKGAFDYNKGQLWARFNFNLNHLESSTQNEEDIVKSLAARYLDVELTTQMCLPVMEIINQQEPVASFQESGEMGQVETQFNSGILNEKSPAIMQLIAKAKEQIKEEVFLNYKRRATDEFDGKGNPRTKEDKITALVAFGIPPGSAGRYMWSGNTVTDQSGNPVNFYALAGIQTE
jgi:hypothetical protein